VKVVVVIARVLLGLIFFILGLNGFLNFIPAGPIPGPAGAFLGAMFQTHYLWLVAGVQVIAGALLLANQYVPLALVALAAVIANILTYHITMMHEGWPLAAFVTVLWFIVAWSRRAHFAPLFARKTST